MSSHEVTVVNIYGAQPFPVCPAELLCDVHALQKYVSFFTTHNSTFVPSQTQSVRTQHLI